MFVDATTCGEKEIVNGSLKLEEGVTYRPGDKVKIMCDDGYQPNYENTACKTTGRWGPVPKCTGKLLYVGIN